MAKFKEAPENFLKAQMHAHAGHVHAVFGSQKPENGIYVCPMDPEVRESKSGACPKCGMALEPAAPAAPSVLALPTSIVLPQCFSQKLSSNRFMVMAAR